MLLKRHAATYKKTANWVNQQKIVKKKIIEIKRLFGCQNFAESIMCLRNVASNSNILRKELSIK